MSSDTALIDSHCHLDLLEDAPRQWQQCQLNNIHTLIIPATEPNKWTQIRHLSEQLEGVYWSAGIHPWWAQDLNPETLQQQTEHQKCVAVGECGLDKSRGNWPLQLALCQQQLAIASELQLPLILHCYRAHNELIQLLSRYRPRSGGVVHGFSGSIELAQQYIKLGFLIGIGATISYPRAKKTIATLKQLPEHSLLLETDAPSMPLYGNQGQTNSPIHLPKILQLVAAIRGQAAQEIATICNSNCRQLFTKIQ